MSKDTFTKKITRVDQRTSTGLTADYVNELQEMYNTLDFSKIEGTNGYERKGIFLKIPSIMTIDQLSNLPLYRQRYEEKDNAYLYNNQSLPQIEKLDAIVTSFNTRSRNPKDYTLIDLESHFEEIYFTVQGKYKKRKNK